MLNGISVGMQVKAYFVAISFEGKKGGYYKVRPRGDDKSCRIFLSA
ncbi:MAG: hypothetical protein K6A67_00125 [Bacteroidales bacterium]|nr:hypothetical protein [Bacteroidales bacterium]